MFAWQRALAASTLVAPAAYDDDMSPLELIEGDQVAELLLYLRRYWHAEGDVVSHIRQRVASLRQVDEAAACSALAGSVCAPDPQAALGQAPTQASRRTASPTAEPQLDLQQWACALALRSGLTVITGGPGTGNPYAAARLLALLFALSPHPQQMCVALAGTTGKAAVRLRQLLVVLAPPSR